MNQKYNIYGHTTIGKMLWVVAVEVDANREGHWLKYDLLDKEVGCDSVGKYADMGYNWIYVED
jgi:hypothetical protein